MAKKFAVFSILFILLILLIGISFRYLNNDQPDNPQNSSSSEPSSSTESSSEFSSESSGESKENPSLKVDTSQWNYILVNSENALDQNFKPTTKELPNGVMVDERIYDSLTQMLNDARAEGLEPVVCSGYRPYETQQRLFQTNLDSLKAQGHSEEEAYRLTAQEIAVPGTSEHQTGLAVDIVALSYQLLDENVMKTDEVKWLYANCHKYGFIVRYPEGKQDITKIIYEPWHYRYVGVETATEIMEQGLCYEEYLEQ